MSNLIRGVIFDWAGTTIDFGCFAPLNVFVEIFKKKGIDITVDEAREPMGMSKKDHVRAILSIPRVSKLWEQKKGRSYLEIDVDDLYEDFEPLLMETLHRYTDIIEGVIPVCEELRKRNIKIGSTTGYTKEMMKVIVSCSAKKGYKPDCIVTAEDVAGEGRPSPSMIFKNMQKLEIYPPKSIVKAGDTISDIKEGINAGVWSVGVIKGSSEMGLKKQEFESLTPREREESMKKVRKAFMDAGADFVINDMSEMPNLIDKINSQINDYVLLTPGPLSTTKSVKNAMLSDWCTWDDDYNSIIREIRENLVDMATDDTDDYTAVLMQGSGTFSVESVIGTVIPEDGKLLVLTNGAYGNRIVEIANKLKIEKAVLDSGEKSPISIAALDNCLKNDPDITHVAVVHCETTTGILNDIEEIGQIVKQYGKKYIVDGMSSFGGIPMDVSRLQIDYLISSSNKCIQGVPGFGFVITKKSDLINCEGQSRSLSLDLFDQWTGMEKGKGKWRYTSPTHVVKAFQQALWELNEEGGIESRHERFKQNQKYLVEEMKSLGFKPLLEEHLHSPIITSFYYPKGSNFSFNLFYNYLKEKGYVIYPGKVSKAETFRIGNIGNVDKKHLKGLVGTVEKFLKSSELYAS